MFISLSGTCIQNFSNLHTLFVFVFFYILHSVAFAAWSGIQSVDPQMIHFELFITWCAATSSTPKQYLFSFGSWRKKYILGIHLKKIIITGPFHSKASVLLYKFETSWALLSRLGRDFFAISGPLILNILNGFSWPLISGLGLLTMWVVESPILYLSFFKTILAALFRTFGLPLRFLPSKPSFLHDHFTTQHSDFSNFLAVSTTDKLSLIHIWRCRRAI